MKKVGKTEPKTIRMSKAEKHQFVKAVVDSEIAKAKKNGYNGAHVVIPAVKGTPNINQTIRAVGLDPRVEVAAMAEKEGYTIRPVRGGAMIFSDRRKEGPNVSDLAYERAMAAIDRIRRNS